MKTYSAATKISAATFAQTRDRAGKVAFIALFNNCVIVAKDWRANKVTIMATDFAARGIARLGGFNVVEVGTASCGEPLFEVDCARSTALVIEAA